VDPQDLLVPRVKARLVKQVTQDRRVLRDLKAKTEPLVVMVDLVLKEKPERQAKQD
jgi:hypothetical protein